MLAGTSLGEEGVEGVISGSQRLVGGHLPIGLDAVLQAVEFPAGVANLAAGLADVDGDALALRKRTVGKDYSTYTVHLIGKRSQTVQLKEEAFPKHHK